MSRTQRTARGMACALTLACTFAFGATVYRWTDERGVTHYSDAPPAGTKAVEVAIAPAPAQEPEAIDWRKRDEEFQERHRARQKELDESIASRKRTAELEAIRAGAGIPVPGDTLTSAEFQKRVLATLVAAEHVAAPACANHSVVRTEALGRDVEEQRVFERWVLARCGDEVVYRVTFAPGNVAGRLERSLDTEWPPPELEWPQKGWPPRESLERPPLKRTWPPGPAWPPAPGTEVKRRTGAHLLLDESYAFTFERETPAG